MKLDRVSGKIPCIARNVLQQLTSILICRTNLALLSAMNFSPFRKCLRTLYRRGNKDPLKHILTFSDGDHY